MSWLSGAVLSDGALACSAGAETGGPRTDCDLALWIALEEEGEGRQVGRPHSMIIIQ